MPHPEPKQTALLADFLTVLSMQASGEWPMPVVEAIAQREDEREDARTVGSDESR